jgi:hypothetical protein
MTRTDTFGINACSRAGRSTDVSGS